MLLLIYVRPKCTEYYYTPHSMHNRSEKVISSKDMVLLNLNLHLRQGKVGEASEKEGGELPYCSCWHMYVAADIGT